MLTNTRTWIDERYEGLFPIAADGRHAAIDGNVFPEADVVRLESEKRILYLKKQCGSETLGFYVKIEEPGLPQLWQRFIRKRLRPRLRVSHEFQLLDVYRRLGIPAAEAVALVEQRFLGIPVRGLIIQKEVVGREFTELLKSSDEKTRKRLLRAYGRLMGELHSKGIISSTVRVTDIICVSDISVPWRDIELVIIDREHGPLEPERYDVDLVCEKLASLLSKYIVYVNEPSPGDLAAFVHGYFSYLSVAEMPDKKMIHDRVRRAYLDKVPVS